MTHLRLWRLTLSLLGSLTVSVPAFAQTSNATLQGTVTDTSGGVLPGVTVRLQAPATGLQRDATTNTAGLYVFNFLPPGKYVVAAELMGFKTIRHDDIQLEIGQNRVLDMKLDVGRIEETVVVEGTAPLLDRTPRHRSGRSSSRPSCRRCPSRGVTGRDSCCWRPAPSTPATARI